MTQANLHERIFDTIRDPLLAVDGSGDVLAANATAIRLFDLAPGTGERAPVPHARLAIDAGRLFALVRAGARTRGVPVSDLAGRDTGLVVDLEPMPAAPGQWLLHFRARSEGLERELWTDEAVASVAHELRNPLAAMKSALDAMSTGATGEVSDAHGRFIEALRRGTARLGRLVDGYLDLARVRAGVLTLSRAQHDVRALVGEFVDDMRSLYPQFAGRLEQQVADDVGSAFVDLDRMNQVLVNLVGNAIRFTPDERRVRVRVSTAGREVLDDDLRLLPWDVIGDPRWIRFDVEDQGIGMTPETLAHAFERYHRPGPEPGPAGAGAHLGLHISRSLVEAHAGWVHVESRLGEGTVVSVFVPADEETAVRVSRLRTAAAALVRLRAARRPVLVAVLGASDTASLGAVPWAGNVRRNPDRPETSPAEAGVWELGDDLAVAILPGANGEADVAGLFVSAPDSAPATGGRPRVLPAGVCAVDGQVTFAQALGRAMSRMLVRRAECARAGAEPESFAAAQVPAGPESP